MMKGFLLLQVLLFAINNDKNKKNQNAIIVAAGRGQSPSSPPSGAPQQQQSTAATATTIQRAMRLTELGSSNISSAYEATELWEDLLRSSNDDKEKINNYNDQIRGLMLGMYGSCLVR